MLALLLCLCVCVSGQFGLGRKKDVKKQKSAFEQAQERASSGKPKSASSSIGSAGSSYGSTRDADIDAMMASLSPEDRKMMEGMMAGMGDVDMGKAMTDMEAAMSQLASMDADELNAAMMDVMNSPEIKAMLDDPTMMLEQMRGTGMMPDETIDEYLKNPKKYKREMKKMQDEMMKVFTDPEAMQGVVDMMTGVTEMLSDPKKLEEALEDIVRELEQWETDLGDAEKVEAARQQLLNSPDLTDNPALAEVFGTKEMKDIIGDKEKWRKTVMEGKERLRMGGGVGEL